VAIGVRYNHVIMRFAFLAVVIGLLHGGSVCADDNVREVQTKLSDEGFYSGEIDGAYSTELAAALSRYQVRNGLPITGQLDVETSQALGAKPAVGPSTAAYEQNTETWRRLRKGERRTSTKARETPSARTDETTGTSTATTNENEEETATTAPARQSRDSSSPQEAPPPNAPVSSESAKPVSAPPARTRASSETMESEPAPPATAETGSLAPEFSLERLHDYVAAFVLAGLDRNVGAEVEFYGDRVDYYDNGTMEREKIREDLKRYDEQWPERHFWIAGKITIEPQSDNRLRVTFPLGFKLRNGNRIASGKVDKTLVLEKTGDDLQIVAVNERKPERK
jgi:peptidoglycan hydrolase-like protein with peptidoglycan-binding domain